MMRSTSCFLFVLLGLGACASHGPSDPAAQAIVDSIASANADITRLTVHAKPAGHESFFAIASTSSDKRGRASDAEDLDAMRSGEIVVLDEPGAIDVTVPIGRGAQGHTMATGVTMRESVGRAKAIEEAKRIAAEIERALAK